MDANHHSSHIVILTNFPDQVSAQAAARHLLELKLAACVNVLSPCWSMYHWQGKIETANEVPMLVKALSENFKAIEDAIREKHPYEMPEIIALPIIRGYAGYLNWINSVSSGS